MNTSPKPPRDWFPWIYWGLVFIVVPFVGLWMTSKPALHVSVPVPVRELPPYHVIIASDLITRSISPNDVVSNTVRNSQEVIGRYTRQAIAKGKPIREDQVAVPADARLISNTLAVAIPATRATILGGKLRAGDAVSLVSVPISDTNAAPSVVFNIVLVLDVIVSDKDAVIVLAIPSDRWLEYLAKTRNAQVVLARRVE